MLSAHSCPVGTLGAKDTGGMSVYIRELARELGNKGHMVDVYTRVHDPNDAQIIELGPRARLIHVKAGQYRTINKLAVYYCLPQFIRQLENFRIRNGLHYDLIFSHYWLSGWAGSQLHRWWAVPHIMMFHALGMLKNAIGLGENEPKLRIKVEQELVKSSHHIIATTKTEKKFLTSQNGVSAGKVTTIPCGINLELFNPMNKERAKRELGFDESKIVLFVGRVQPVKGVEQLIRAMTYLQDGRATRLVIVGGDENSQNEIEKMKALCQTLNIENSVLFQGSVKQSWLPCFYNAADVCVISSYYESFGLVPLESLACGTPVVATNVGGVNTFIRHGKTGYMVADNEPQKLADGIDKVLSLGSSMDPQHIRQSVSGFAWSSIAESIGEVLYRVLVHYHAMSKASRQRSAFGSQPNVKKPKASQSGN